MRVLYRYIQGQRYKVGFSQSVAPIAADTNETFERRMATLAEDVLASGHGVELAIELNGKQIVAGILNVTLAVPIPAPITADVVPTGQRRGRRGGGGGGGQKKAA